MGVCIGVPFWGSLEYKDCNIFGSILGAPIDENCHLILVLSAIIAKKNWILHGYDSAFSCPGLKFTPGGLSS